MHDKLKLLLQKVNLPNEYYDVFNNGKILKLKLDSSRKNGVFVVEVENIIPSNIIDYINKNVTKAFADMNTIKVEFISKNINYNDAINFYSNAIEKSTLTKPMKELFKEKNVSLDKEILTIDLDNIAEENI